MLMEFEDDSVALEVELDVSVDEVWAALTRPEGLSAWLGAEVIELDVRSGGRGTIRRADGAVRRISVELVDPGRRLSFRWWPFVGRGGAAPVGSSLVEFIVEERDDCTLLRVVERAPLVRLRTAPGAGGRDARIDLPWTAPPAANELEGRLEVRAGFADRSVEASAR